MPSAMYGMSGVVLNESELEKLYAGQNRVAKLALNAPKYVATETLGGDTGWSTFRGRQRKATLTYKVKT